MLDANRPMRPKDIEKECERALGKLSERYEDGTLHIQVTRVLERLYEDEGLIKRREKTRKHVLYSIKNEIHVRHILTMARFGWDVSRSPESHELPMLISGKTYREMVQKLSKLILDHVLARDGFPVYAHARSPKPIIMGFPIPISQEKGNVLKDRILIAIPDGRSATKIRTFTQEQYKAFVQYLTDAWASYFEGETIIHDNIVILHLSNPQAERLRRIVELGEAKSVDEVVHLATSNYLDTYDPSKKELH